MPIKSMTIAVYVTSRKTCGKYLSVTESALKGLVPCWYTRPDVEGFREAMFRPEMKFTDVVLNVFKTVTNITVSCLMSHE